jgi:diguanylate cyclase (GGDEF)-like protein
MNKERIGGLSDEQEANFSNIADAMGPELSPKANAALESGIADQIRKNAFEDMLREGQTLQKLESDEELARRAQQLDVAQDSLLDAFHEKKTLQKELETIRTKDSLTGLLDRRGYQEEVAKLVARLVMPGVPKRTEGSVEHASLLILDIDNFKKINDEYGHSVGDIVLKEVAHRLCENLLFGRPVRPDDIAARWGGEEFVFIFPGTREQDVKKLMTDPKTGDIRKLSFSIVLGDDKRELLVTLSGGLTEYVPGESFPDATFDRADGQLYIAKHSGKNRIETTKAKPHPAS